MKPLYRVTLKYYPEAYVRNYQENLRVYLDEYPEQRQYRIDYIRENFRLEYQKKERTIILVPDWAKRIARIIGGPYISKIPTIKTIETITGESNG